MTSRWTFPSLLFGALTTAAALIGTAATRKSVNSPWYRLARKPPYQPPRQLFGPVWTGLYGTIATSGAMVYQAPRSPARTRALALWGAQLALNAGWSVLFFGARRPRAALAEIGVLLGSVLAYGAAAYRVDKKAAYLVAPYAAWTGFATALNAGLVRRNPQLA